MLGLFCFAVPCVHSSFAIISLGKRELVALLLLCFECPCRCYCHLTPPQGVVGWSVVIMVFPGRTHFTFLIFSTLFFSFAENRSVQTLILFLLHLHTVNAFLWGGICS